MTDNAFHQSLPRHAIDGQGPVRAPFGLLTLSGWIAGWQTKSAQVRMCLGPKGVFHCKYGTHRPDVSSLYPELPGADASGFSLEVHIPQGFHVATLEYRLSERENWTPFRTFSILADLSPLVAQLECSPPSTEADINWEVQGWCFHVQAEIKDLTLEFAHQRIPLDYGLIRHDVAETFPQTRLAATSGFFGRLRLEPGNGAVYLTAVLSDGSIVRETIVPSLNIPDRRLSIATLSHHKARASVLRFTKHDQPEVSIVIPIFNHLELTLSCLESLVAHAGSTSFEVIIIDDNSESHVGGTLALIEGLRVYSNEVNQGFVQNCNRGAAEARGNYLLFLNNDTEVTDGWLESMIQVFNQRPKAGAVGAKLVYPDGRLQEAGGIIWEDGSGWNYGKGDDPERPEYNYLRQVDYASGACLLVRRQLFLDLGGFDSLYRPAYYEDTDLAFAIRNAGFEVYYQPAAKIIHFEGVSSGTDILKGVKRHQTINREKFTAKWSTSLRNHGRDTNLLEVARDRYASCRILVIDACALTPDADSGSLRMFNLLIMMSRHGAKVTFAAENLQFYEPYSTQLRLQGIEHLGVPHVLDLPRYVELHAYAFDVIILSRKYVAEKFIDLVRRAAPRARIVFDTVDLMYLRLRRQAVLEQSVELKKQAEQSQAIELSLCAKADLVFAVSPIEVQLLASEMPREKIALISNIHAFFPGKRNFAERKGVMFVGGFQHPPNVDAVKFFLDEILPIASLQLPNLEVHVVGSNMPASLQERASSQVHMHGFVPDLNLLFSSVLLTIAPLRYGAGVKGKVNQSMAHGVPVVATSIAAEGMHLVHNQDVLIADTATDFAQAIVNLHDDQALWERIVDGGGRNIEKHFSFAAVEKKLFDALGSALFFSKGIARPLVRRPAAPYRLGEPVLFGETGNSQNYTGLGWSHAEGASRWMVGKKASLDFQIAAASKPSKVKIIVYPFLAPPINQRQRLVITTAFRRSPVEITAESPARSIEVEFNLDVQVSGETDLTLTFQCPDAIAPSALGCSSDLRELSFAFLELTITD